MGTMEIRVHGMGDHKPSSALGSLPRVDENLGSSVEEFETPKLPGHTVRLVNWSRTSRRKAGFLWYLALPFTLLNVAGEMGPADKARRRVFGAVVVLSGLVLTIAVTTWVFAILETVVKRLPWRMTAPVTQTILTVVTVAVAILVLARIRNPRRCATKLAKGIGFVHVIVFLGYSATVVYWRPAIRVAPDGLPDACEPIRDFCEVPATLDLVTTVAIASGVLMLVLAGAAWYLSAARHSTSVRPRVSPGSGAAFAIVTSLVWIHVTGSVLRLGVDWMLDYFHRYPAVRSLAGVPTPRCELLAEPVARSALPPCERVLLVFDENRVPVFLPDIVATYGFAAVVALALALALALVARRMIGAQFSTHQLVLSMPKVLSRVLATAFALFIGAALALHFLVFHPDRRLGWWYMAAITVTHIMAAAALAFVFLGRRSPTVRKAFGMIADVLGFWPVTAHPLAGQSYRDDVVAGIRQVVDRHSQDNVVLAAHSQGSVLCAWLAAKSKTRLPIHLVTCGSPLASLYETYFPLTFNANFFAEARANVDGWTNYWRSTDPIATALPTPGEDLDKAPPDRFTQGDAPSTILNIKLDNGIKGHSDYWIDCGFTPEPMPVGSGLSGPLVLALLGILRHRENMTAIRKASGARLANVMRGIRRSRPRARAKDETG